MSWWGVCSQASSDRWIVCADFHDLVEFVKGCSEENKLEAEQCTYENVREWGLTKMTDTDLLKMKEKKILLGSKISKGIISYIPAHYMVWEWTQGAAIHGVRFPLHSSGSSRCFSAADIFGSGITKEWRESASVSAVVS